MIRVLTLGYLFDRRFLGPERSNGGGGVPPVRFFSPRSEPYPPHRPSTTGSALSYPDPILSALGDITNQLCCVQTAIVGLDSKVDGITAQTITLSKRLSNLEENRKSNHIC